MSKSLPPNPNLEYDKKQAKALLKAYHAGDAEALERVRSSHPRLENVPERSIPPGEFKLSDAQLVIAREYGFSSWPRLKHHIDIARAGLDKTFDQFASAVSRSDTDQARQLLEATPALAKRINDPVIGFDAPPLLVAAGCNNRELVDVLIWKAALNLKSPSGFLTQLKHRVTGTLQSCGLFVSSGHRFEKPCGRHQKRL